MPQIVNPFGPPCRAEPAGRSARTSDGPARPKKKSSSTNGSHRLDGGSLGGRGRWRGCVPCADASSARAPRRRQPCHHPASSPRWRGSRRPPAPTLPPPRRSPTMARFAPPAGANPATIPPAPHDREVRAARRRQPCHHPAARPRWRGSRRPPVPTLPPARQLPTMARFAPPAGANPATIPPAPPRWRGSRFPPAPTLPPPRRSPKMARFAPSAGANPATTSPAPPDGEVGTVRRRVSRHHYAASAPRCRAVPFAFLPGWLAVLGTRSERSPRRPHRAAAPRLVSRQEHPSVVGTGAGIRHSAIAHAAARPGYREMSPPGASSPPAHADSHGHAASSVWPRAATVRILTRR